MTFELPWLVEPLKELVFNRPGSSGHFVAGLVDRIKLFCTVFDPTTGRYRFDNSLFVRAAAGLTFILGVLSLFNSRICPRPQNAQTGMIERVHSIGRGAFRLLRRPFSRAFDSEQNPLNSPGRANGVFSLDHPDQRHMAMLIFFRTSVSAAFDSVEYLTREQWYVGGVMRSLHRYASDAAIITILTARYQGIRV